MRRRLLLFRTLRKDITLLFVISLLVIVAHDFWVRDKPEMFQGSARLGGILYNLSLSYVSAFLNIVVGSCWSLIDDISRAANVPLRTRYPTHDELTSICKAINPNLAAPMIIRYPDVYANWVQFFDMKKQRSNDATQKIFQHMPFLDSRLVNLLTKIEECSFFMVIQYMLPSMPLRNNNIVNLQKNLADYFELVRQLENYSRKELRIYR
ncbi:MAG: hypothetical protein ACJ75B_15380 [Flavisolibacter sp.]